MNYKLRRVKREVPDLNTTSTADISFMLLILFLVTTSMDIDKGITRQLPPQTPEEEQVADVKEGTVMQLNILADNSLTCDGEPLDLKALRQRVTDHVAKAGNDHVIQIEADRNSSYDAYFHVQNEIVAAYSLMRDREAKKLYGKAFARCSEEQQQTIREKIPQRISETYIPAEGGSHD